jgi:hypothetical protein
VETIGVLEDRYEDWQLAIGYCQQLKKQTQGDSGSQKKLATALKQMTYRNIPARFKGLVHKRPTVEKI